ncbi:MAG: TetR/AcrR family transcriptional regulator [bacterium]
MSIEERKQREKEALRNKIIQAASQLVSTEGHENVSIRKIARAVEYSPRTIYLYFRDKEHLLQEVVEAGFERTLSLRSNDRPQANLTPVQQLRKRLTAHVHNALAHPNFYRAVVTLIFEKEYTPGPAQQKIIAQTRTDIARSLPPERRGAEEVDNAVRLVFSTARGFTLSLLKINDSLTDRKRQQIIDHWLDFMIHGLQIQEDQ